MRSRVAALLVAACGLLSCSDLPAPYVEADAPRFVPLLSAPQLVLVLGGGGPRGFAHIGVLKAFDAAGVKPDLIVGSSVGAVIGSIWASGMSATAIEKIALELEVSELLSVRELTLSRWGWFRGERLVQLINGHVQQRKIEQFPMRFVAVATDIPSGAAALFNAGNAGHAVHASSAIPGRIVPARINNKVYVDGDLVSPVPIRVARRLGAKRVIAVDVSADLADTPALEHLALDWITTGATRNALIESERTQADLFLPVKLPYYAGGSQAYRVATIAAGEAAARAMIAANRGLLGLP
jgi:NTE family protein